MGDRLLNGCLTLGVIGLLAGLGLITMIGRP
jgi:hypothetical protein